MVDTRMVKNILIETLVNLNTNVSFVLNQGTPIKLTIMNKWYYNILKKWSKSHKMTLNKWSK